MKTFNFTEENAEAYSLIYESVRAYPVKGIEEIIKASTIIESLKSIGKEAETQNNGLLKNYVLKELPTILTLEDEHFNYIKKVFDSTPWSSSLKIELLAQMVKLIKFAENGLKLET